MDRTEATYKDRWASYNFVISILWIGFVMAISFMEAPLRFRAESITVPMALQIGRLVFHALNGCEIVFAVGLVGCHLQLASSKKSNWLLWFVIGILVVQTVLLFAVLDARTNAIIAGESVGESHVHSMYIALEFVKLVSLALLAHSQIRDFKAALTSGRTS